VTFIFVVVFVFMPPDTV